MCQPNSLCAGLWVERSGFKTRLGHFVMFLGKTLYFHLNLLHPGVEMGNGELSGKPDGMLGGNVAMEWHPIQGGEVALLLIALCYRTWDKLWLDGALSSRIDLNLFDVSGSNCFRAMLLTCV